MFTQIERVIEPICTVQGQIDGLNAFDYTCSIIAEKEGHINPLAKTTRQKIIVATPSNDTPASDSKNSNEKNNDDIFKVRNLEEYQKLISYMFQIIERNAQVTMVHSSPKYFL